MGRSLRAMSSPAHVTPRTSTQALFVSNSVSRPRVPCFRVWCSCEPAVQRGQAGVGRNKRAVGMARFEFASGAGCLVLGSANGTAPSQPECGRVVVLRPLAPRSPPSACGATIPSFRACASEIVAGPHDSCALGQPVTRRWCARTPSIRPIHPYCTLDSRRTVVTPGNRLSTGNTSPAAGAQISLTRALMRLDHSSFDVNLISMKSSLKILRSLAP
jgi:hypothetical protein